MPSVLRVVNYGFEITIGQSMKTISRKDARAKTVGNILASLRIERLSPSPLVVKDMQACLDGNASIANVLSALIKKHVAVRRD